MKKDATRSPDTVRELAAQLRRRFPRAGVRAAGEAACLPTGVAALDTLLPGGGLPFGRLSVLAGPASSGRTGLTLSVAARITREGGRVGWVDVPGTLHPPSADRAGLELDRLLVVRPPPAEAPAAAAVLLEQQAARLVVLDLTDTPPDPDAAPALARLARAVSADAACLVLSEALPTGAPLAQAASLVVGLSRARAVWQRTGGPARLEGLGTRVEVLRSRFGGEGSSCEVLLARPV